MAALRAKNAIQSNDVQQYGRLAALLSVDPEEDRLAKVAKACQGDLNTALEDPAIAASSTNLDHIRSGMEDEFLKIDQSKAEGKAKADMAFTRRTLNTLFHQVNIYSLSPVLIFDLAKISPESAGFGGVRYGLGGGLRLEFASTAHFTVGYAWNTRLGGLVVRARGTR